MDIYWHPESVSIRKPEEKSKTIEELVGFDSTSNTNNGSPTEEYNITQQQVAGTSVQEENLQDEDDGHQLATPPDSGIFKNSPKFKPASALIKRSNR